MGLFSQPTHKKTDLLALTRESSLTDNEVIASIHVSLTTKLLSSLLQKSENLLVAEVLTLLVGSTGNLGNLQEVLPNGLGLGKLSIQIVEITRK